VQYHALDPQRVVATIAQLCARIRERFPAANLGRVADELLAIANDHARRSSRIREPNLALRAVSVALILGGLGSLGVLLASVRLRVDDEWRLSESIQTLEAGVSMLFFLGAGAVFALSLDLRSRRRRCLRAVHEIRAMAHIVDMHQLTKDPERIANRGVDTPSSPPRPLSRFELVRYLDYCSEMLSLMGKVAALYVQDFPDPEAMSAVDDVEELTTSLSRKIWQKIMILEQMIDRASDAPTAGAASPPGP
jgi:hypothetical protein